MYPPPPNPPPPAPPRPSTRPVASEALSRPSSSTSGGGSGMPNNLRYIILCVSLAIGLVLLGIWAYRRAVRTTKAETASTSIAKTNTRIASANTRIANAETANTDTADADTTELQLPAYSHNGEPGTQVDPMSLERDIVDTPPPAYYK